jgi:hypothetical protein
MPTPNRKRFRRSGVVSGRVRQLGERRRQQFARRGDSGRLVTFHFCPQCGGTVFWQAEQRPEFTAVAVGAFGDPTFASPRVSVWESRKHLWIGAIGELEIERSQ